MLLKGEMFSMFSKKSILTGCPVTSVKISPWKYNYESFEPHCGISDKMLSDFDKRLMDGDYPVGSEYGFMFVSKYCTMTVENCICGGSDFYQAKEKLVRVYEYCRERLPMLSPFVVRWLCGMYLSKEKQNDIPELFNDGIYQFPFAKDYATGDYICAFLRGEGRAFPEKMFFALKYLSDYNYKKSCVYERNREIYEKALCAVLPAVFEYTLSQHGKDFFLPELLTVTMQGFPELFCRSECESLMEISYIPFSQNVELFELISACVKHTDNLLRQGFGIKSKLVGFTLSTEYRKLVADTIRAVLPGILPMPMKVGRKPKEKTTDKKTAKREETKTVYEPIDLNIDFSKAKKLETESWRLAQMLSGDYGGNDISFNVREAYDEITDKNRSCISEDSAEKIEKNPEIQCIPEDWQEFYMLLSEDEKKILCLCAKGMDASEYVRKTGGLLQGFADSINEKASDAYGDIIIEMLGKNIGFIEEYEQELTDIFLDMYNTEVL